MLAKWVFAAFEIIFLCSANKILITNVLFVFFPHLIVLGNFAGKGGGGLLNKVLREGHSKEASECTVKTSRYDHFSVKVDHLSSTTSFPKYQKPISMSDHYIWNLL